MTWPVESERQTLSELFAANPRRVDLKTLEAAGQY